MRAAGNPLEYSAQRFFDEREGIHLTPKFPVEIGVSSLKKPHLFDLGSDYPAILVECKSHTWTQGQNVPSAKMAIWNEAMYFFHLAPSRFRKVMFVLKHLRYGAESLAERYLRTFSHLIPDGVELWEFDERTRTGARLFPPAF